MHLLSGVTDFLKTLTFVDYVFFFAIVILLVLIITLLYFIKSNNELFLQEKNKSNEKENDLKEITQKLEEEHPRIEFTPYEKDQEEKAIISYDELLAKSKNGRINYEEEHDLDGLSVKKINLDESIDEEKDNKFLTSSVRVISYQNEELFLQALKQLQKSLS